MTGAKLRNDIDKKLINGNCLINKSFFGLFENKSAEFKKLKAIEVYRFFFRFSIEKLQLFIHDPFYLALFLEYLRQDKMKRVHQRDVLQKHVSAYYTAVENLLNFS
jgi:ABC-type polysaccharide transport system permease subunit